MADNTAKYAIRKLSRGPDGQMKVKYLDSETGQILTSLEGYKILSAWGFENDSDTTPTESTAQGGGYGGGWGGSSLFASSGGSPYKPATFTGTPWGEGVLEQLFGIESKISNLLDKVPGAKAVGNILSAVDKKLSDKFGSGTSSDKVSQVQVFPDSTNTKELVSQFPELDYYRFAKNPNFEKTTPSTIDKQEVSNVSQFPELDYSRFPPSDVAVLPDLQYDRFSPPSLPTAPVIPTERPKGLAGIVSTPQPVGSVGPGELRFSHPEQSGIDLQLQDALKGASLEMGQGIDINSGYRSPEYNRAVGGAKKSYHMSGQAADIDMSGLDDLGRKQLVQELSQRGMGGFITYSKSPNMLHVDMRPRDPNSAPQFMFDRTSQLMDNAPSWFQEMEQGGWIEPLGEVPTPTQNNRNKLGFEKYDIKAEDEKNLGSRTSLALMEGQSLKDMSPAQLAKYGYGDELSPSEKKELARVLANEIDFRKTDLNTPEGQSEAASIIASVINRKEMSNKAYNDILEVINDPNQYSNINSKKMIGVQNSNLEKYGNDIYQAIDNFYDPNYNVDFNQDTTHYYNPDIASPGWGFMMDEPTDYGPHRFGDLRSSEPYSWSEYNPSDDIVDSYSRDQINRQSGDSFATPDYERASSYGSGESYTKSGISATGSADGSVGVSGSGSGSYGSGDSKTSYGGSGSSRSGGSSSSGVGGSASGSANVGGGGIRGSGSGSGGVGSSGSGSGSYGSGSGWVDKASKEISSTPPSVDTSGTKGGGTSGGGSSDLGGWDGWI